MGNKKQETRNKAGCVPIVCRVILEAEMREFSAISMEVTL